MRDAALKEFKKFNLKNHTEGWLADFVIIYQQWDAPLYVKVFEYVQWMADPTLDLAKHNIENFTYENIDDDIVEIKHLNTHFAFLKVINKQVAANTYDLIEAAKHYKIKTDLFLKNLRCSNLKYYNGHGPVPGTAKRRGGNGYYRHPKTKRDFKQSYEFSEDKNCWEKATSGYIANAWDDIRRNQERSWKAQRKTQKAWQK